MNETSFLILSWCWGSKIQDYRKFMTTIYWWHLSPFIEVKPMNFATSFQPLVSYFITVLSWRILKNSNSKYCIRSGKHYSLNYHSKTVLSMKFSCNYCVVCIGNCIRQVAFPIKQHQSSDLEINSWYFKLLFRAESVWSLLKFWMVIIIILNSV